jgi:hypothetical protein
VGYAAKALLAGAVALVGALATAAYDGLTLAEWLTAGATGLAALAGVYRIPNRPPRGRRAVTPAGTERDPTAGEPRDLGDAYDDGYAEGYGTAVEQVARGQLRRDDERGGVSGAP